MSRSTDPGAAGGNGCRQAGALAPLAHGATERAERAGRRLAALVDPDLGLIAEVAPEPPLPGEPDFAMVTARLANVDRLYPVAGFSPFAAGTAPDAATARLRALGEAVERYAGFLCPPDSGPYAAHGELPGRGVHPADWPRCSPAEYADPANPLAPPDPGRRYRWLAGWSLSRREPVYVPALHVCLGYLPEDPMERVALPHATGLAAGESLVAATVAGLCEVLERDAFMLTWCKRLPAPALLLPGAAWPEVAARMRRISRWGLRVSLHGLLPAEPPAKVLSLIWDRPGGPVPVACGLGAGLNPRQAVAKALDEAVQSRRGLVAMATAHGSPAHIPATPEEVRTLEDHLTYYLKPERLDAFAFLKAGGTMAAERLAACPDQAPEAALAHLVEHLAGAGQEVIRVDLTPEDLAAAGLRVVRVLVPGRIPLAHGQAMRFLAMPRWQRFPGAVSPEPHPFG